MYLDDRSQAGVRLAAQVGHFAAEHPRVFALLPGGAAVAVEIARALRAPLDVLAVREFDALWQRDVSVAASACGEASVVSGSEHLPPPTAAQPLVSLEIEEAIADARRFAAGGALPALAGRTALLVDDGMRSPGAAVAAGRLLRRLGAARVILALPFRPLWQPTVHDGEFDEVLRLDADLGDGDRRGSGYRSSAGTSCDEISALLAGSLRA